jgi:AraC-like DNA-binding protein
MHTGIELRLIERDAYVDIEVWGDAEIATDWAGHDFGMGIIVTMCRQTLGEYVSPFNIECRRPRPADPDLFESILGSRLSFDCPMNRITFVKSDINELLASANPQLATANDEQTETYLATFTRVSCARAVVSKIVEHLPDGPPSQKLIADAMNISNRTLQRKLKEEGTSFIDLLQDARLSLAKKYLAQPQRSIVEIAYLLGFSEPSTFSRAFKRWTGKSPADYRAEAVRETEKT